MHLVPSFGHAQIELKVALPRVPGSKVCRVFMTRVHLCLLNS